MEDEIISTTPLSEKMDLLVGSCIGYFYLLLLCCFNKWKYVVTVREFCFYSILFISKAGRIFRSFLSTFELFGPDRIKLPIWSTHLLDILFITMCLIITLQSSFFFFTLDKIATMAQLYQHIWFSQLKHILGKRGATRLWFLGCIKLGGCSLSIYLCPWQSKCCANYLSVLDDWTWWTIALFLLDVIRAL